MYIRKINPVAKALMTNRRRQQIVKSKKGKGSYERSNSKKDIERQQKES